MLAIFYRTAKKTNSTLIPSGGTTYQITLKSPSSILNPTIELALSASSWPDYNYCYISEFGRFYWVQDTTYNRGFWVLTLKVDALASWKSAIGAATLYVLRAASEKDGTIVDTMYPLKVDYSSNQSEQTEDPWWALQPAVTSGCFIVGVRGRIDAGQTAGGVTYLVMTPAQFRTFTEALFADDLSSYLGTDPLGIGDTLAKMIFNPAQYICSAIWLPGVPSEISASTTSWHVGWWSLNQTLPILNPASRLLYSATIPVPSHPQAGTRGVYMSAQPATQRLLLLPRLGVIALDDPIIAQVASLGGSISVTLQVDPISGEGIYSISAGGVTLDEIHCQIGVSIPLSSGQLTIQDAIGAVASPVSDLVSASTGNYNGLIADAGASIGSALSILQPHIVQLSGESGYLGLVGAGICRLYSIFRTAPEDDNTEHGRPLCKNKQISTLSGFVQVLNGDLAISGATQTELEEIRALLEGGFYYE